MLTVRSGEVSASPEELQDGSHLSSAALITEPRTQIAGCKEGSQESLGSSPTCAHASAPREPANRTRSKQFWPLGLADWLQVDSRLILRSDRLSLLLAATRLSDNIRNSGQESSVEDPPSSRVTTPIRGTDDTHDKRVYRPKVDTMPTYDGEVSSDHIEWFWEIDTLVQYSKVPEDYIVSRRVFFARVRGLPCFGRAHLY